MIPTIGPRLKELRQKKNLRQEQVAAIIGVKKGAVSSYENGSRQPSYDILISLARLYRTSTDYLLGLTDVRNLDVSGLSDHEIEVLCQLISIMVEKNGQLKK